MSLIALSVVALLVNTGAASPVCGTEVSASGNSPATCHAAEGGGDSEVLLQSKVSVSSTSSDTADDNDNDNNDDNDNSDDSDASEYRISTPQGGDTIIADQHEITDKTERRKVASHAFDKFDVDGSGELNAKEIHNGIFSDTKMHTLSHNMTSKDGKSTAIEVPLKKTHMDLTQAQDMIDTYDADNSGGLSKSEFLAAAVDNTHEIKKNGASFAQRRTGAIDKCVAEIFGEVWVDGGCFKEITWSECSGWNWFGCIGKATYKSMKAVGCHMWKVVNHAVSSFDKCMSQIIDAVKGAASAANRVFMDNIGKHCSSADSCWDVLKKGPVKLLNVVGDKLKEQILDKMGPLKPALPVVNNIVKNTPSIAKEVGSIAGKAAGSIVNFVVNSGNSIAKHAASMPDLCAKGDNGFWYIVPTDCDGFSYMRKIFSESFKVWRVKSYFDDTVSAFGRCITKTGMLGLPSPFMDIKVTNFCLPQFIQKPIKGIVGSFKYMVSQVKAVAGGCKSSSLPAVNGKKVKISISGKGASLLPHLVECGSGVTLASKGYSHATSSDCSPADRCYIEVNSACQARVRQLDRCKSQQWRFGWSSYTSSSASSGSCKMTVGPPGANPQEPVCQLAKDMSEIGKKLMSLFTGGSSLLETAAKAATAQSKDGKVYGFDCGADMALNVDLGTGVIFPDPTGGMLKPFLYFQAMIGCRKRKPFFDIAFGLGLDKGVLGKPDEIKKELFMKIGFNMKAPPPKVFPPPGAAIKFALAVDLKSLIGIDVAAVFAFGVKPAPGYTPPITAKEPAGFTIVLKAATGLSLLGDADSTALSSRVQQAVDDTEDYDEKVIAAYRAFASELANLDLAASFERAVPDPNALIEKGFSVMKDHGQEIAQAQTMNEIVKPNCLASLNFRFCLTCILGGDKEISKGMGWSIGKMRAAIRKKTTKLGKLVETAFDYPSCKPSCLNGGGGGRPGHTHQIAGKIYKIGNKCWKALTNCNGCLPNPAAYSPELYSVACEPVYIYPACGSDCLTGGTHLKPGSVYKVGSACYYARDNCYGCIGSPASHPASMAPVACPDKTVTAYDYPSCKPNCLKGGKYQLHGAYYKVAGQCYRANGGCWGCLDAPGSHSGGLWPTPCP